MRERIASRRRPERTALGAVRAPLLQPARVEGVEDVLQQAASGRTGQRRRHFTHQDRTRAERLQGEAEPVEVGCGGDEALGVLGRHLHHVGDQEALAGDAAGGALALQPLVDEALMGRVLVDEDDPVAGLGDDVGLVELGAGGTQRVIVRQGLHLRLADIGARRREIAGEQRLPGFLEPCVLEPCPGPIERRLRSLEQTSARTEGRCRREAGGGAERGQARGKRRPARPGATSRMCGHRRPHRR